MAAVERSEGSRQGVGVMPMPTLSYVRQTPDGAWSCSFWRPVWHDFGASSGWRPCSRGSVVYVAASDG